jgi:hypothetical protein
MQILVFTLNAIVVYLLADLAVREIERRREGLLEQRQAVFFVIFLILILASSAVLRELFRG